ncbi:MarR family transcriptional regulator [Luedemannella flava]|uniref:MarR family transcriptional regulator n=1 Tax=Luedemannella flava TaxID=349316 RepID=A0ABN2LU80_9ACTN
MPAPFTDDDVNRLRIAMGRTVRELDRRTNVEEITRAQLTVLATIAREKRIGLAELAEYEGINPTMLSRVVGKLEQLGFVRRTTDDVDRRVAHVEITAAGVRRWDKNRKIRTRVLAGILAELSEADAKALMAALPALEALADITRVQRGHRPGP